MNKITNKTNIETSQLTGFYIIKVFPEKYFRTDYDHNFLLNDIIFFNFKRIQVIRKEV